MAGYAQEIVDRVVVLDSIEAARGHAAGIEGFNGIRGKQAVDPGGYRGDLGFGRNRLAGGRHLTGSELLANLFPYFGLFLRRRFAGEGGEIETCHGNVAAVAHVTFGSEERLHGLLERITL